MSRLSEAVLCSLLHLLTSEEATGMRELMQNQLRKNNSIMLLYLQLNDMCSANVNYQCFPLPYALEENAQDTFKTVAMSFGSTQR